MVGWLKGLIQVASFWMLAKTNAAVKLDGGKFKILALSYPWLVANGQQPVAGYLKYISNRY